MHDSTAKPAPPLPPELAAALERAESPADIARLYETFLATADPALRAARGVYATPEPVVGYIVRSAHALLRQRFGLAQGLAAATVVDPACGTGLFLAATLAHTRGRTSRLFGYEILALPRAIAQRTVANPTCQIHHQDALREVWDDPPRAHDSAPLVIVGNPPYSNYGQMNQGPRIARLMADWRPAGERKWNPDDFMKFIRWAQWHVERAGRGIVAFVTPNTYLDGITHRRMRRSLAHTFTDLYLLDLHGNARRKDVAPDGSPDDNIFDIQQGIAIGIFVRAPRDGTEADLGGTFLEERFPPDPPPRTFTLASGFALADQEGPTSQQPRDDVGKPESRCPSRKSLGREGLGEEHFLQKGFLPHKGFPTAIHHAHLWGTRDTKLAALAQADVTTTQWAPLSPDTDRFLFVPHTTSRTLRAEYARGWGLTDIFGLKGNGLKTDRDRLFIDVDRKALARRMRTFYSDAGLEPDFRRVYRVEDSSSYRLLARRDATRYGPANIRPCLYRPFDIRWLYYDPALTSRSAWKVMRHMLGGDNIALLCSRTVYGPAPWRDAFVTRGLSEFGVMAARPGNSAPLFPLFVLDADGRRQPNLRPAFREAIGEVDGMDNMDDMDVFHWLYAVLHALAYRRRYGELLKADFPRVPLPPNGDVFRALAGLGADLVALHLLDDAYPHASWTRSGASSPLADAAATAPAPGEPLPPDVADFHIGGYPVLRKWLRDRRGRTLSRGEIAHYRRIVAAILHTRRLAALIDTALGPWPIG